MNGMELDTASARHIVELLELLTELPSTPAMVAEGSRRYIELIEAQLPMPHAPQEWAGHRRPQGIVMLDVDAALAVIELLDLFTQLPSTPPALAADVQQWSARMRQLQDAG
jgi:hypothetical protein